MRSELLSRARARAAWLMRFSAGSFTRERASLALLLALAVAVRLPVMPFQGYWHDLASYVFWGNGLVAHGFGSMYAARASAIVYPGAQAPGGVIDIAVNYPPGTPYLFAVLVLLYNSTLAFLTHVSLTDLVDQNGLGPFIAKLPLLLADLATAALLYREARKRHSQRFAWLASASFVLSPTVLYDGVVWGQLDALVMLPVLLALFAIFSKRYALGGVCLAVAALIKIQPVILLPLVLLYLWRWARREDFIRFVAAFLGMALLILLPIMIPRFQVFDMIYNIRMLATNDNFAITQDAFNFWWLTGLHARPMGSSLLGVKFGLVADALFGAVTLVIGIHIWRHREPAYLCFGLAMEAFGFFVFMGGQLERYLFPFVPLMVATVIVSERKSSDRLLILYVSGAALCLLNMMVSIGAFLAGYSPVIPYMTLPAVGDALYNNFGGITFIISAYVVATFAYAMHTYLSGRFAPLAWEAHAPDQTRAEEGAPVSLARGRTID